MPGRSGICSICGAEVQHLTMHMKNVHEEKDVQCELCDFWSEVLQTGALLLYQNRIFDRFNIILS